jgi:ferrous iron transport protein B
VSTHVIGLVGNPNCGKTTLFNLLTGARQRVGNWPGVTVDRKEGGYRDGDDDITIVDLPGIYSLDVLKEETALDEKVARDYILSGAAELFINIVDASNLERNLYLTTQLLEMQVPLLIVLNMIDVARAQGVEVNAESLSRRLGCAVVPVVAVRAHAADELKNRIRRLLAHQHAPKARVAYAPVIETAIARLASSIEAPAVVMGRPIDPRWLALKLLEGDEPSAKLAGHRANEALRAALQAIESETGEEADILIADSRYGFINAISQDVLIQRTRVRRSVSDRIDRIVLNRVLGIPIFLAMMYLMFTFTINVGGIFVDFFDQLGALLFVDGVSAALSVINGPPWLTTLLAQGVGGGIRIITTFIPIIGFLYLFLSFLEDSGYMARAAFVMDRLMHLIGLPGKSFVPLLVGFGCNVPAIMATRTLDSERDRFITVAMNPFMSCGARLSVYALFVAAFFPSGGQDMVFALYLVGIAAAVLTGYVLKHTLVGGEATPFIMELPPYHLPSWKSVLLRAWDRLKTFMFGAGKAIIAVVVLLSFLNDLGRDGSFGHRNRQDSLLSDIGRGITPAFEPLGITPDNWPATMGIFTGIFAKEAVVGTLNALYLQAEQAAVPDTSADESFDPGNGLRKAAETIPDNIAKALGSLADPLGLGMLSDMEAAKDQGTNEIILGAMAKRFDGWIGAFSYLLFVLLYIPCVAATGAIYRETNWRWAAFVVGWTTGIAYAVATIFYQGATFARHPQTSMAWIGGLLAAFALLVTVMRILGRRRRVELFADALPVGKS